MSKLIWLMHTLQFFNWIVLINFKTRIKEIASNHNFNSSTSFKATTVILRTRTHQSHWISRGCTCTSVSLKGLTNPIEVPGSTSWNWFRRRSFHSRWSSSVGNLYAAFLTWDWMWAMDAKNSTSWRRNSQNRFIFFTCHD